jgi:hypothetical protein
MPFTPAHAAVAWPIRRALPQLPLGALVIGTLSPDFEYFLHLAPQGGFMHSVQGVLLACAPVSLAVWAFFRRFVRPAVLQFMPTALAKTVRPANASLILASLAVLVGATTHVIWDGFTHGSGWAVTMWSSLRHEVAPSIAPGVPWFKLLQHASTLVGVATLGMLGAQWVRSQPSEARRFAEPERRRATRIVATMTVSSGLGGILNVLRAAPDGFTAAVGLAAVGAMVGGAALLFVLGLRQWAIG